MRFVFLDFDGTLNSSSYLRVVPVTEKLRARQQIAPCLNPHAVARLNRLVKETASVVVICSAWRHGRSLQQLGDWLRAKGFQGGIHGKTPEWLLGPGGTVLAASERGDEIATWLTKRSHDVTGYVILDDQKDFTAVRSHHVWIDPKEGLQDVHLARARRVLDQRPFWRRVA